MRAMVLKEFGGNFELEEQPKPEPGIGEVVVKVVDCGLGLTLEHGRNGRLGGSAPRILGHEFAGHIDTIGHGVERWAVGDAVVASGYLFCGECYRCSEGRETLCINNKGHIGAVWDGAFAEYIRVPARNLVAIPDGVEVAGAGLNADAMVTTVHVCQARMKVTGGQRIAVIGAGGGVGVHMVQMIRAMGGVPIAVDNAAWKLEELQSRGLAEFSIDASADNWSEQVREAAGGRLDGCIDIVATEATLAGAIGALGMGGTLAVVGYDLHANVLANSSEVLQNELNIVGCRYASRAEIATCLEMTAAGRIAPVVGARYPLEKLNDAFDAIRSNSVFGRVMIEIA